MIRANRLSLLGSAAALLLSTSMTSAQDDQTATPAAPADPEFKNNLSYIIGHDTGSNFKQDFDLDVEKVVEGIRDALAGKESAVSPQKVAETMEMFQLSRMPAEQQTIARANVEKGNAYAAENAKREGVQTTDSGLQYEVITPGDTTAASPTKENTVTVHYAGTLIDGTEFDSSIKRGQPTSFGVTQVIPGWTEGLQLMKPGSKYRFVIPSRLAYGFNPRPGGEIKPGDTLVFEVELISIK